MTSRHRSVLSRREFCAHASAALAAGTLALGTGYFTPQNTANAALQPDLGIGADLQGALPFPSDNFRNFHNFFSFSLVEKTVPDSNLYSAIAQVGI